MTLTADELERYDRQILLAEVGEEGQEKLKRSSVLVIGAGGVGCPCALYLAAAGVGTIGLADGDTLALSNLHRQILYHTEDVGRIKVEAAKESLERLNSEITVKTYAQMLDHETAKHLAAKYDFIVEAADGIATKNMIAKACTAAHKPHCHVGIGQFRGQVLTCLPETGNSFSDLFGAGDSFKSLRTGTMNAACGVAGCIQAAEAVKYLLNIGALLTDRVLYFDLLRHHFEYIPIRQKAPCGRKESISP